MNSQVRACWFDSQKNSGEDGHDELSQLAKAARRSAMVCVRIDERLARVTPRRGVSRSVVAPIVNKYRHLTATRVS